MLFWKNIGDIFYSLYQFFFTMIYLDALECATYHTVTGSIWVC